MKKNLEEYKLYYELMDIKKTKMEQKFKRKRVLKDGALGKTY